MFRALWQRVRTALTVRETQAWLADVEQAIQIQIVKGRQAEVNSREGATVANLLMALEKVPAACIQVGSIIIVKYQVNGHSVAQARQLSSREMQALERFPDLHNDPERFFALLADAVLLPPADD